jgi:hypothetical protein
VHGSATQTVALVLHFNQERTHMSKVYSFLNEKIDKRLRRLPDNLESKWNATIHRYKVDPNDRQVRSVFNSLNNIMSSRHDAHERLYNNLIYALHRGKPSHALKEIRAKLVDDPRRVLMELHKRLKKNSIDLDEPRALAAFKAASEILWHFLQLEHDYMRAHLEEAQTHLRLRRARRRQQTLQRSQSTFPQGAESAR